jgi:D-alanine-D-alanine ligase
MKIAIVYNYESKAVINLFGVPNRERYGHATIKAISNALKKGGHQVKSFEGDKNIIQKLEDFMPSVIAGERPGLVFNLSYGIQGRARYTHIPSILEMLGVPYMGSSPDIHALALDKVITKIILRQKGLPTPHFDVWDTPDEPISDELQFPLIVKPKNEAVSYGLRVVRSEDELRDGVRNIYETFQQPTLVEEYIEGREINVGLMGNNPTEALPPVEYEFPEGEKIITFEDKTKRSDRELVKICPAKLSSEDTEKVTSLAKKAFSALGCYDYSRVDLRLDKDNNPYILEINSMASLGMGGSYVFAASKVGLDYDALVNRLVDVARQRYFGTPLVDDSKRSSGDKAQTIFRRMTRNRDKLESELREWCNMPSRTQDAVGLGTVVQRLEDKIKNLKLEPVPELTNRRSAWTWQTKKGLDGGTLLVVNLDVPIEQGRYPIPYRREPEWLYGEGIATSRACLTSMLAALGAVRAERKLKSIKLGVFAYTDEGRGMRYSSELLQKAVVRAKEVIVIRPGLKNGEIITQRRGFRKINVVAEGRATRPGVAPNKADVLSWFLKDAARIEALSQKYKKLSIMVQDLRSEHYSILMPHRVEAVIGISYLKKQKADEAEAALRKILTPAQKNISVRLELVEDRPPMTRSGENNPMLESLIKISEHWKLPFGVGSSLFPSAAGVVPENVPVLCGFGPPGKDMFTPHEAIHRGELLQRTLLMALYLLEECNS